ncbi:unnamed protein product [Paramecium sonneborni]|uniref:Cache domain-containing protein n=1 Tax=Paramecium sonneborni TaxID=65129 RepID=A0A8S1R9E3_9CILI|nr:unnamed protein product [Paramecium sonneborni]
MIIILTSIILLFSLISKQVSQTLMESSEIIFDLNSKKRQNLAKQSLELFWVIFIHSLSQPIISLHRLYNFYEHQKILSVKSNQKEESCYNQTLNQIQMACFCYLNHSIIDSKLDEQIIPLQTLLQFQTALPTQMFGVEQYMGFFDYSLQHLYNYPCLEFDNYTSYDPKTRPWYIEAQKAYNLSNFQQYSLRLTGHYLTIPFNDVRFSIALPLINYNKSMIGALRVHIQSKILQDLINNEQRETNLILTTNDGMLLVNNLLNNSDFELGKDYFYNQTKTGFNLEDWESLIYKNQSNCEHIDVGFICRQNKIDQQDYYMLHTSLEQYNLKIILYQTKYKYEQYIQNHQIKMKAQINEGLIQAILFLIIVAVVTSFLSSFFLRLMIKPLQQIARIFRVTQHSSSKSITQRFKKFNISDNYAGIFKKPSCWISKDVFLFCQCIQQFISNFSSVQKKSNIIYEYIDSIKYPKKDADQTEFIDQFQEQMLINNFQRIEINQSQLTNIIRTSIKCFYRKKC